MMMASLGFLISPECVKIQARYLCTAGLEYRSGVPSKSLYKLWYHITLAGYRLLCCDCEEPSSPFIIGCNNLILTLLDKERDHQWVR
ncbi:hypothetical protein Pcinc_038740 [Petrolisthes cinctipes]|uniref:Uncharacterized protein n=1 Tax=Petrolisthes cinctipes TaxID=88211 RepID=A0AAE1BTS0_PETCI|nr:hypothetical protein Pcinc_038740 [Petrolisthes cinctipes]